MNFPLACTQVLCIFLLAGCATGDERAKHVTTKETERYASLASQATPAIWKMDALWVFIALDQSGQVAQSTTFRITQTPAEEVCTSGNWKVLEIVAGTGPRPTSSAYLAEGRNIQVLLDTRLCDSYNLFVGSLDDLGFTGTHRFSGLMGSKDFGMVYGAPAYAK